MERYIELSDGTWVFRYDMATHRYDLLSRGTGVVRAAWGSPQPLPARLCRTDYGLRFERPGEHLEVWWQDGPRLRVTGHPRVLDGQLAGLQRPYLFTDGWHSWNPGGFQHDPAGTSADLAVWSSPAISLLTGFPHGLRGRGRLRMHGTSLRIEQNAGETLWLATDRHMWQLLERFSEQQIQPLRPPHVGWCSWYAHEQYVTEDDVLRAVDQIRRRFPALKLVQLDAGYQKDHHGQPHGGVGDWTEANAKFPHGLRWLVEEIHAAGLQAGLWLAPFLVSSEAGFAQAHPEAVQPPRQPVWFLSHACQIVDGSAPAARQWLQQVAHDLTADLGFDYLKLDFMHCGADPVAAYRSGLESLRAGAGSAWLLGCGAPLLASVGLVDGLRVGGDLGPRFDTPYGVSAGIRGMLARSHTHRRWWIADPDCLLLTAPLHADAARAHLTLVGMTGGLVLLGDRLEAIHTPQVLERILPPHPYRLRSAPGLLWFETPQATVLAIFNASHRPLRRRLTWSALGLEPTVHVFDYWAQRYLGRMPGLTLHIPAQGCRVLRLTSGGYPAVVGLDGHLRQEVDSLHRDNGRLHLRTPAPTWIAGPRLYRVPAGDHVLT